MVQRSAPSWLVFRPGSSYWVPAKPSASNIAKLVEKLSNPLTEEESLAFTSAAGWPSSSYFLNVSRIAGNGSPEPVLKDTEGAPYASSLVVNAPYASSRKFVNSLSKKSQSPPNFWCAGPGWVNVGPPDVSLNKFWEHSRSMLLSEIGARKADVAGGSCDTCCANVRSGLER
ncbi:hypothetical protein V2J09_010095 [Rumex salicifolius]